MAAMASWTFGCSAAMVASCDGSVGVVFVGGAFAAAARGYPGSAVVVESGRASCCLEQANAREKKKKRLKLVRIWVSSIFVKREDRKGYWMEKSRGQRGRSEDGGDGV